MIPSIESKDVAVINMPYSVIKNAVFFGLKMRTPRMPDHPTKI
jgi:hypothetical protein